MNNFCSIFSQLLQLFPRVEFQHMVRETHAERHAKGFTCWGQFVAILVALLRMNLFTHRDLWAWLNKPFEILPAPYESEQLNLNLA